MFGFFFGRFAGTYLSLLCICLSLFFSFFLFYEVGLCSSTVYLPLYF